MWLSTDAGHETAGKEDRREELRDRLLAISPELGEGPAGLLLLPLTRMSRYWKLDELPHGAEPELGTQGHPLLEKLAEFHRDFGLRFSLAPTAPWAIWLASRSQGTGALLELWDREAIRRLLWASPLAACERLIDDELEDTENRAAFDFLVDCLGELGLSGTDKFLALPPESLSERFGPLALKLLKRIRGADDRVLKWYQPSLTLERRFHPKAEMLMGSEETEDMLARFQSTLQMWEARLAARKLLLRGLRMRIRSERRNRHEAFFVSLPRPSRDAESLYKIMREKWLSLSGRALSEISGDGGAFEDEIDEVVLESMGLESDSEAQLDLFDPQREARREAWNTLLGRLHARATKAAPIRAGFYRPVESYVPEEAVEWLPWEEAQARPMIEEHPKRPVWILREPVLFRTPQAIGSEEDFLRFLERSHALSTVERVSDLWRADGARTERTYARLGREWIYWDRVRQRAFLHGYFEGSET